MKPTSLAALIVVALLLAPGAVNGHAAGQSYVFLTLEGDRIEVRSEITVADLNQALSLRLGETADVDALQPHLDAIQTYVRDHIELAPDGDPAELLPTGTDVMATSFGNFVQTSWETPLPRTPAFIDAEYHAIFSVQPEHTAFLVIENNWLTGTFNNEALIALTFIDDQRSARLDMTDSSVLRGFSGMVRMGAHHIWIGIDHILFLVALLLPSVMQRRRGTYWEPQPDLKSALLQVVKIVTAFTIAHTVTLSLAALELFTIPSRLVESVIAISIAIVALDILVPVFRNWIYSVVLAFGLFHGFGFASVLAEMPIPANYLALSLLGFNLGVEIGQVAIVMVAVPILFAIRNWRVYPRLSMPAGALLLMAVSLYWFVERAFQVDLPAGAIVNHVLGLV